MGRSRPVKYPGKAVDVEWSGRHCIHVGECGRAKGELFTTGRTPWCDPDLVTTDEVVEVVERCPSGALSYVEKGGVLKEKPVAENSVHVVYNGPLYFKGDLDIDAETEAAPGLAFRAALCRCGQSGNKPFCDNSHEKADFTDYGAVGERGPGCTESGGKLEVKLACDGPILVKGNLSIVAASGRVAWQGRQVALCRCGASENKPFCDGTHKKIGFKA